MLILLPVLQSEYKFCDQEIALFPSFSFKMGPSYKKRRLYSKIGENVDIFTLPVLEYRAGMMSPTCLTIFPIRSHRTFCQFDKKIYVEKAVPKNVLNLIIFDTSKITVFFAFFVEFLKKVLRHFYFGNCINALREIWWLLRVIQAWPNGPKVLQKDSGFGWRLFMGKGSTVMNTR